jgi:hypothetical protein
VFSVHVAIVDNWTFWAGISEGIGSWALAVFSRNIKPTSIHTLITITERIV